jgi:very-short-patch-repair endonuclease
MNMDCWNCGKPATKSFGVINVLTLEREKEAGGYSDRRSDARSWLPPSKGQRAYCDTCFEDVIAANSKRAAQLKALNAENMAERALRILEKGKVDVYQYRAAIDKVLGQVKTEPEWFGSADEVVAAIVLVHKGHSIRMQYKVGGYRVDICLPKWKVLLEIDGIYHKGKRQSDAERDQQILSHQPQGWRIVRIPTELLEKNPSKLVEAINALLKRKSKGGITL